jgi:predicted secreted hydrolase
MIFENNKDQQSFKSAKNIDFLYSPEDISLEDDSFHGSTAPRFTEWWYFDAVFDNGYTIQMSVRFLSIIKNRFLRISRRFNIYKNGELIQYDTKTFSGKKSELSKKYPMVKLDGETVINGKIDNDGKWVYDLYFHGKNMSADLIFEGDTKGWKGKNPGGDRWNVILPKANVKGILKIKDKKIEVQGIGYHDHNVDVRVSAARDNLGWVWGKINSKNFTATWATIYDKKGLGRPILVVNENKKSYINICPKDIEFIGYNLKKRNGKYIPYHFDLKAKTKNIIFDISMDVSTSHYVKKIIIMDYWRYHVLYKGSITINGETEKVNNVQMAEFVRFR